MSEETPRPQINASKLLVGGGIAGLAFTIGSMLIFLLGVPILRYLFPPAILLGMGVAVLLRFKRHQTPGTPWLMSATEKTTEAASEPEPKTRWNLCILVALSLKEKAHARQNGGFDGCIPGARNRSPIAV